MLEETSTLHSLLFAKQTTTMRLTSFASFLCLVNPKVWAHFAEDAAPEIDREQPTSPIETVIPNRSYVLKLDCISCPYLTRPSNRNEWEKDTRPNQLTLALYIEGPFPRLYLQGEKLNPLYYERRVPPFCSESHPFAPPFTANQIGVNTTLQQEEDNNGYGMPIRQFELAYEFDMVTYAPKDRVWEWEVLIQFDITGLRHEEHVPKDIPFLGSGDDGGREGTVPGVTGIVRLALGYTAFKEMEINALELMPKELMAPFAGKEIEALRKAAELKGDKSITTANWGGRLRDINGPDGKDMYTEHVSFKPGEWNDCGKDEWGRQILCAVDDFRTWSPVMFVMSLVLMAAVMVVVFVLVVFVSWFAIRFLRGQKTGEVVMAQGENDALLLFGDEELEEEEEKTKEAMATQNLHQIAHAGDQEDSK